MRRAQLQGSVEVVHNLGHDARPVDGIDRYQARAFQETLVGKAGFDHFLAVVEVSFNGDVMDIFAEDGRHLTTLHLRHAVMRVHDENIDVFTGAATFNRRRAGITRGCAHNHDALTALRQYMV